MTLTQAIKIAKSADAGDYLIEYADTGLTDAEDPGSRCGFGDDELAEIEQVLARRGLSLRADDEGLLIDVGATSSACDTVSAALDALDAGERIDVDALRDAGYRQLATTVEDLVDDVMSEAVRAQVRAEIVSALAD
jgi:hypothetical protein